MHRYFSEMTENRQVGAALVIVRYCGWHADPGFAPWFLETRDLMSRILTAALDFVTPEPGERRPISPLLRLAPEVQDRLRRFDPDGDGFETTVGDHLSLVDAALRAIGDPDSVDLAATLFEHVADLAEAATDLAENVDFAAGEQHVQLVGAVDLGRARQLSLQFSALYAGTVPCYYEEDSGGLQRARDVDPVASGAFGRVQGGVRARQQMFR
ncbi:MULTISPECIES: hypothetical protein [Actinoplanes]|uniref:hypothetical protein n=1 Tax=Actinoplanes TaxID=1865 RepID=UPI0005F28C24|nr:MULTISPECIES: hypothetical protein [Actinoplanes]GLY03937.1 hypothetical protein Acsp01_43160 [Actinoplanes sp. NBRC 101535]